VGIVETSNSSEYYHYDGVQRYGGDVKREKHEKLLIFFTNAIVYPRAMVVHFAYAPPANRAVMGPLRFDAAALLTFVYNFARLQLHAVYHLLRGVANRNSPRVGGH